MKTQVIISLVVAILLNASPYVTSSAGPLFGQFCPPLLESWLCNRDTSAVWITETCGGEKGGAISMSINISQQVEALVDFYYETGNTEESGPLYEKGWLSDCQYCLWQGVTCDAGGNVTGIESPDNSPALTGSFPTSLLNLQYLETLNLRGNEFIGTIPSEVGLLSNLTSLILHYNNFEGVMPDEICALGTSYNGGGIYITADCQRPNAEVDCPAQTCCDACFYDAMRFHTNTTS